VKDYAMKMQKLMQSRNGRSAAITVAILAAVISGNAVAQVEHHRADLLSKTAHLKSRKPLWTELPISRGVQPSTLRLVPAKEGAFSMIGLRCERILQSGKLSGCEFDVEPKGILMQRLAKEAIKDIRVDKRFVKRQGGDIESVYMDIRVSNSMASLSSGPCWPPYCTFIPAPPVPPPPPPPEK